MSHSPIPPRPCSLNCPALFREHPIFHSNGVDQPSSVVFRQEHIMVSLQDNKYTASAQPLMAEGSRSRLALDGKTVTSEESASAGNGSNVSEADKLGWIVTALFIVADMVGGGVVVMPVAFRNTGMICGSLYMVTICSIFLYTGYQLGVVWNIMQTRWKEYHDHCRRPFPEIALRSMGPHAQKCTTAIINVTLFGIAVVYLLLSAEIINSFLEYYGVHIGNCKTICVLAVVLAPFTFAKSPADFWPVIVVAMATTTLAVLGIVTGVLMDTDTCYEHSVVQEFGDPIAMIGEIGAFLFAFSGHFVFPSIQHDMRDPTKFTRSVCLGFLMVVLLYMPLSIVAYRIYGDSLLISVVYSVQTIQIQLFANAMIAVHCILTLVIVINPVNQELEDYFNIAHHLGRGRIFIRCLLLALVTFTALSMPSFIPVLNVVGSSTIPLGCVILPSLFYLFTKAAEDYEWQKDKIPSLRDVIRRTPKATLAFNIFIMVASIVFGIVGTYFAVVEATKQNFQPPCYLQPLFETGANAASGGHGLQMHCCGSSRNVYYNTSRLSECNIKPE